MNAIILSQTNKTQGSKSFIKLTRLSLLLLISLLSISTLKANTVYTWTGAVSTDWADPANWTPSPPLGGPYGCNADVIIPVTANSPTMASDANIGNIHLLDNAILTLKTSLAVCQNWTGGTNAYATVIGPGVVIFESPLAQTISGITQMPELYLDNTSGLALTSGAILDLYVSLDLKSGNFDVTAGTLTFKSNSVDSAAFIDNFTEGNAIGTVTGPVTVERYYASSSTFNQRFLGSPVNSPSLTQFGASGTPGFISDPTCDETHSFITSPYGTLFTLHESNGAACALQQWEVTTSGNAQNMLGYSYLNPGAGKLILKGMPNLDSIYTISGLTNSNWANTSLQGHHYNSGWQLISNPYLAEVNLTQTQAGFDNQVQIWNAEGPYAGSYQPLIVGAGANIAPFQAFMVHKTNPGGTASYTIAANERVRNITTFYAQSANRLNIIATNANNGLQDQTTVAFNVAATADFDPQFDAEKLPGALNRHTIYTTNGSTWMAVNVLPDISSVNTIPMGFEPGANGMYSLNFNGLSTFDPTVYIYLEDQKNHIMYNVRNGDYAFTADSADAWNRFVLHFSPPAQITSVDAGCTTPGNIQITQAGTASWNYTLTDGNNTVISAGVINQNQPANIQAVAGSYTLTLKDIDNYTVAKTIIINSAPAAVAAFTLNDSDVQINQSISLAASADNSNYLWNFGDGTTATGATATISYADAGIYAITLTVQNQAGCSANSTQTVTVSSPSGVSEAVASNNTPAIWSNSNIVYVDFAKVNGVDATVIIYDILGRQVSNERIASSLLYQHSINNIQAGYFIVSVANGNETTTKKVLITNAK